MTSGRHYFDAIQAAGTTDGNALQTRRRIRQLLTTIGQSRSSLKLQLPFPNLAVETLLQHRLRTDTIDDHLNGLLRATNPQGQRPLSQRDGGATTDQGVQQAHITNTEASHQHQCAQPGKVARHTRG
ncbi:hypothetical protein [Synechococcus sp. A15-60]|uniref:hypothetical protein n=1 Tax=Synechococcus sp. A15-60 TaxID=1050655 RepID=UPI002106E52B|nr:hypothetical protein [Synechococcus sp. A15-60]